MKSLIALIEEGLPIGVLLKHSRSGGIWQRISVEQFQCIADDQCPEEVGNVFGYDTEAKKENHVGLLQFNVLNANHHYTKTTAWDCGIEKEALAVPEPFWTGHAAIYYDGWNRFKYDETRAEIERGELWTDNEAMFLMEDCQPCLPFVYFLVSSKEGIIAANTGQLPPDWHRGILLASDDLEEVVNASNTGQFGDLGVVVESPGRVMWELVNNDGIFEYKKQKK